MPRSGQPWDAAFHQRSELFRVYEWLTRRWAGASQWPSLGELTELAEQERAARTPELRPLRFAAAAPKPRRWRRTHIVLEELYDGRIELRGEVPCLEASYHDLWNAVVFAAFPRAKRALHARQFRALRAWVPPHATQLPSRRTREQDALTVFDEGGSVVLLAPGLHAAWQRASDGIELEPGARPDAAVVVFGHALLELAQYGRADIRSGAVVLTAPVVPSGRALFDWLDVQLAAQLQEEARFLRPGPGAALEVHPSGRLRLRRSDADSPDTARSALEEEPEQKEHERHPPHQQES